MLAQQTAAHFESIVAPANSSEVVKTEFDSLLPTLRNSAPFRRPVRGLERPPTAYVR